MIIITIFLACDFFSGWSVKKELDPATLVGALATVGIGVLIYLLGKRLTTRRFEREYIITLLKGIYPITKQVHNLFYTYRLTHAPITEELDLQLRAQLTQLSDQIRLVTEAIMLMKKHCKSISASELTNSYRTFKRIVTANTLGHSKTFDLTPSDISAEDLSFHALLSLVHSFIFELNVV